MSQCVHNIGQRLDLLSATNNSTKKELNTEDGLFLNRMTRCICVCAYIYTYTHTHTHTHIYDSNIKAYALSI